MWVDDDGMLVIRGRLTPEAGAVVQRALEAAADRLFRESRGTASDGGITEEVTPGQRRADALAVVAESALAGGLDRGTTGDRYQVVVHVDAATLQDASTGSADAGQAVVELGDGGVGVSAETSQRVAGDASVVVMRHGADGSVPRRRTEAPDDSARDPARARGARDALSVPRMHGAPV